MSISSSEDSLEAWNLGPPRSSASDCIQAAAGKTWVLVDLGILAAMLIWLITYTVYIQTLVTLRPRNTYQVYDSLGGAQARLLLPKKQDLAMSDSKPTGRSQQKNPQCNCLPPPPPCSPHEHSQDTGSLVSMSMAVAWLICPQQSISTHHNDAVQYWLGACNDSLSLPGRVANQCHRGGCLLFRLTES